MVRTARLSLTASGLSSSYTLSATLDGGRDGIGGELLTAIEMSPTLVGAAVVE